MEKLPENELVVYCIRHMGSKKVIHSLFESCLIKYKASDSYAKLAERFEDDETTKIDIKTVTRVFRENRKPFPKEVHLNNLKSGLLVGHSWHGAMPSMLHLSLQEKVRNCIDGTYSLNQLISIGTDIMKHEYFMVAAHDLCENAILENFPDSIPPVSTKSISDFVLNGIPYDLKNTNYFSDFSKKNIQSRKEEAARFLLEGADVQRLREQAKKTMHNWGLNRFYVLVEDQDRWLTQPEAVLEELIYESGKLGNPIRISIQEIEIQVQLIAI